MFFKGDNLLQIKLHELGEQNRLGFGVVWENYGCDAMPGLKDGTVGYHIRDGRIFGADNSQTGKRIEGIYYPILDFFFAHALLYVGKMQNCMQLGTNKAILLCPVAKIRDFAARFPTLY